ANVVETQKPTAGTVVVDTGAPAVELTLRRNSSYVEHGTPDDAAPYPGTAVQLAPTASQTRPGFTPRLEPVAVPKARPRTPRQTVTTPPIEVKTPVPKAPLPSAPAATDPAASAPAAPAATVPVFTPTVTQAAPTPAPATPAPAPVTPPPPPA